MFRNDFVSVKCKNKFIIALLAPANFHCLSLCFKSKAYSTSYKLKFFVNVKYRIIHSIMIRREHTNVHAESINYYQACHFELQVGIILSNIIEFMRYHCLLTVS